MVLLKNIIYKILYTNRIRLNIHTNLTKIILLINNLRKAIKKLEKTLHIKNIGAIISKRRLMK